MPVYTRSNAGGGFIRAVRHAASAGLRIGTPSAGADDGKILGRRQRSYARAVVVPAAACRANHRREAHVSPEDLPQRRQQLKEASGLTWSELARRLGTNPLTLRRWRQGARPNALHLLALLEVAASLDLPDLLSAGRCRPTGTSRAWAAV